MVEIVLTILMFLAMVAVLAILGIGVFGMLNPQKHTPKRSNRLMRWRIFFQALALLFFAGLLIYYRS
jgi:predicted permease